MNLRRLAFSMACAAALLGGCNSNPNKPQGATCTASSECAVSLLCSTGICVLPEANCLGELDCGNGYCCNYSYPYYCAGNCYASIPTTSTCSSSSYLTCK